MVFAALPAAWHANHRAGLLAGLAGSHRGPERAGRSRSSDAIVVLKADHKEISNLCGAARVVSAHALPERASRPSRIAAHPARAGST
jgi:hypothetical protein